jgi:putative ABC transport system substrate-binding protein
MRRREFIAFVGGAAAWPGAALAQAPQGLRRVGILMSSTENDKDAGGWLASFRSTRLALGWTDGTNIKFDIRWTAGEPERMRDYASELLALKPAVLLAAGTLLIKTVQGLTSSVPIVFVQVSDPVDAGFVATLARQSGNLTGFTSFEYSMSSKWLHLLKQMQPTVGYVSIIEHPGNPNRAGYFRAIEVAGSTLGVNVAAVGVRDDGEIVAAIERMTASAAGGLLFPPDSFTLSRRDLIIQQTLRHRVPAIYAFRTFATNGGLMSYGVDNK